MIIRPGGKRVQEFQKGDSGKAIAAESSEKKKAFHGDSRLPP